MGIRSTLFIRLRVLRNRQLPAQSEKVAGSYFFAYAIIPPARSQAVLFSETWVEIASEQNEQFLFSLAGMLLRKAK